MQRWSLAGILALALMLAIPASASANKNQLLVPATCDGTSVTVRVNLQSNENAAAPVVGGGSFKAIEGHFFFAGTTEEAFSFTTNFPKPPNVTCTGSFTDPESGQLLDLTITGVLPMLGSAARPRLPLTALYGLALGHGRRGDAPP